MRDEHGRDWSEEPREHLIVLCDPATEHPLKDAPVGRCESASEGAMVAQEWVHQEAAEGRECLVWLVEMPSQEVVAEFRCRRVSGYN